MQSCFARAHIRPTSSAPDHVPLGIELHLDVAHAVGLRAPQVGGREVEEVILRPQHLDVGKKLEEILGAGEMGNGRRRARASRRGAMRAPQPIGWRCTGTFVVRQCRGRN
jgi:hypothetical protein